MSSEPPAKPKDASTNIISLGSWHLNVTVLAGSYNSGILVSEVSCKSRGKSEQEQPLPDLPPGVTPQNHCLSLPLQLCPTKKGVTVIDSSKYTQIPPRIPKNFVSNNAKRKSRTKEMGNKKEALGVSVLG